MSFRGRGALRAQTGAPYQRGGRGRAEFEPVPRERRGRTIRRLVAFFWPYWTQIAAVLVAILITSFLVLVNPFLLKLLIDDAIGNRDFTKLNVYVGLMIGIPIASGL